MKYKEITKVYTRKAFINLLKESDYGCNHSFIINITNKTITINCPYDLELDNDIDICHLNDSCENCWLTAIKNVKFKDEV